MSINIENKRFVMNISNYVAIGLLLSITSMGCSSSKNVNRVPKELNSTPGQQHTLPIGDNSEVSLDWAGTYRGLLPCADCPGIRTVLTLDSEGTYVLQTRYLDRGDEIFIEEGTFAWDASGSRITLSEESGGRMYLVGENRLIQLDGDGQRITGDLADLFVLTKMDQQIRDIYWELVEINGQSLEDVKLMREPYLRIRSEDQRVEANGGCNGMNGNYELDEEHNRLRFSALMSTKMACENMDIEQQLAEVLHRTDSYAVANDTLQLFRARMAPLARFRAVYVR